MPRDVKLSQLDAVLAELDYPVSPSDAEREIGDVTLVLAEGTQHLGDLLAESNADAFDSPEDLAAEVMNLLPQHAVGEPYQSEGEG